MYCKAEKRETNLKSFFAPGVIINSETRLTIGKEK